MRLLDKYGWKTSAASEAAEMSTGYLGLIISIISQAFYGNRTGTEIRRENIDRFILGYQTDDFDVTEPVDRTNRSPAWF